MNTMNNKMAGFTLIEVVIVVAIIGIMAVYAYSSYSNQVMRTNRSDAKAALNDASQRLQRCYTLYSAYNNATDCDVFADLSAATGVESSEGMYRINVTGATATSYTLTATAIEAPQTNDADCDTEMNLTHTGRRTPDVCWD